MQEIIEFIKFLKGTSQVEINNLTNILDFKSAVGKPGIYFCCGLGQKLPRRCKDEDITTKKYFVIDIDIRQIHYEKTGEVMSQTKLDQEINKVVDCLFNTEFENMCGIVKSGNGMHLYYAGTERSFEVQSYSNGVSAIYEVFDNIVQKTGYYADKACHNISRIMRMPGTINPRKKIKKDKVLRDLGDYTCNIIYFSETISQLFEDIELYAKDYESSKQEDKQALITIREIVKKDYKKQNGEIWEQINQIPACDIACDIRGVTVMDRGLDNVALRESKKNMGAYWYKPNNIIVNTGSSLIKTSKSYFTSYELVLYEMFGGDKRKTNDYFQSKYGINFENKIEIPKTQYEKKGYLYGNNTFDKFECAMSGELVTVVAMSNNGKTTFAMDMIQKNNELGKKCFYINLEFAIETVREGRRLFSNGKTKKNLTDLAPLTQEETERKNKYIQQQLKKFSYHNEPKGMTIEAIAELIINKNKEGFGLFVIDTFSRITGNLDSNTARTSQNRSMEVLQELCQSLGIVIIILHHTNKQGTFEGSQKIMDLSNVFIMINRDKDLVDNDVTTFKLSKDKYVSTIEIQALYTNHSYVLAP